MASVHLPLGSGVGSHVGTGTPKDLNTQNKCRTKPNRFLGEGGREDVQHLEVRAPRAALHPCHCQSGLLGLLSLDEFKTPSPVTACTARFHKLLRPLWHYQLQ